jgi:hypothetical protein
MRVPCLPGAYLRLTRVRPLKQYVQNPPRSSGLASIPSSLR